jgi:hypothetical protein
MQKKKHTCLKCEENFQLKERKAKINYFYLECPFCGEKSVFSEDGEVISSKTYQKEVKTITNTKLLLTQLDKELIKLKKSFPFISLKETSLRQTDKSFKNLFFSFHFAFKANQLEGTLEDYEKNKNLKTSKKTRQLTFLFDKNGLTDVLYQGISSFLTTANISLYSQIRNLSVEEKLNHFRFFEQTENRTYDFLFNNKDLAFERVIIPAIKILIHQDCYSCFRELGRRTKILKEDYAYYTNVLIPVPKIKENYFNFCTLLPDRQYSNF